METDAAGNHLYLGYVVQAGPLRAYHSGDTRLYPGMAETLAGFHLHLGLLPINGWAAERRVKGNLDCAEAAALGRDAGIRLVVPHHFDMFPFNTGDPSVFLTAASLRRGLRKSPAAGRAADDSGGSTSLLAALRRGAGGSHLDSKGK